MPTCTTGPCWTASTINAVMLVQCVATGLGKWLVGGQGNVSGLIGNSIIQYSTDGITWTTVNLGNFSGAGVTGITFGNNRFVAYLNAEWLATSTDGINWTTEYVPAWGGFIFSSIGYGNGYFFYRGGVTSDRWYYSTTGIGSWTPGYTGVSSSYSTGGFTYGNSVYVTAGSSGFLSFSDFNTAPTVIANANPALKNVVFGNGAFVATDGFASGTRTVKRSTDGVTWTNYTDALPIPNTSSQTQDYWNGLVFSQGYFLACRVDSNELCYSVDGITWTLTSGDHLFDSAPISGGRELASNESGEYLSVDLNFTQVGICPCAVPISYGEYWTRLSNVVVKNVSIRKYSPSPPSPPPLGDVILHITGDGSVSGFNNLVDSSSYSHTFTYSQADIFKYVSSPNKYYSTSANGSVPGYLFFSVDLSSNPSYSWTWETWFYATTVQMNNGFSGKGFLKSSGAGWIIKTDPTTKKLGIEYFDYNIGYAVSNSAVPENQWVYLTMTFEETGPTNGTLRTFINGNLEATLTDTFFNINSGGEIGVGFNYFYGPFSDSDYYFSDFRVTRGVARYTSSFTPPTGPLPLS